MSEIEEEIYERFPLAMVYETDARIVYPKRQAFLLAALAELTESRDEWKRQWQLMEAAEKKAEEQIAALDTEVEQLKFGREPLLCPRADK